MPGPAPRTHRPSDEVGHRLGRERRQEDAVAVVADGGQHPVEPRPADARRVVRCGGPQPGGCLEQLELVDAGDDRPGVAEQLVHRAGPHRGVRAALLDRRPHHDRAVAPRHEVHGAPVHEAAHRARQQGHGGGGIVRRAEPQDVALDGAEGGQPGVGEPGDGGEPRPGRQDDAVGSEAAAVRKDQRRTGLQCDHGPCCERDAAAAAGLGQRAEQRPVVDLVVAGDLAAAAQAGAERGDDAAALAGAATVRLEAERVLVGEEVVEAGAIGRIERDGHRARRVVTDGVTGGRLQAGGEAGPAARALHEERREGGLAELDLGDRSQHPGRHPRRTVTPGGRRDHRHLMTVA